ncbi:hypothetical protein VTN77DRAFT_2256 [Rasamsonia byssochlamydoides]|uniref:uncharacterized protein n=1 Tax=Rasamsonia byssochlamydoides TaxID=89139 RepID=UPI00374326FC
MWSREWPYILSVFVRFLRDQLVGTGSIEKVPIRRVRRGGKSWLQDCICPGFPGVAASLFEQLWHRARDRAGRQARAGTMAAWAEP